jgi:hypothetical protein
MKISSVLTFLWLLVRPVLEKIAQGLWDEIWEQIIVAIQAAEAKWVEAGRGEAKKADVVATVMAFIESRRKLSWLEEWFVRMFVGKAVDAIIAQINEAAGKDWGQKVAELEQQLADKLPVVS